jgi:hypothetical protein
MLSPLCQWSVTALPVSVTVWRTRPALISRRTLLIIQRPKAGPKRRAPGLLRRGPEARRTLLSVALCLIGCKPISGLSSGRA